MGKPSEKKSFDQLRGGFAAAVEASAVADLESIKTLLDGYCEQYLAAKDREELLVGCFLMVTRMAGCSAVAEKLLAKPVARKELPPAGKPYRAVRYHLIRPALTRFAMGYNLGSKQWLRDGAEGLLKALLSVPL